MVRVVEDGEESKYAMVETTLPVVRPSIPHATVQDQEIDIRVSHCDVFPNIM